MTGVSKYCQKILGEPGNESYCGELREPDEKYCETHLTRADRNATIETIALDLESAPKNRERSQNHHGSDAKAGPGRVQDRPVNGRARPSDKPAAQRGKTGAPDAAAARAAQAAVGETKVALDRLEAKVDLVLDSLSTLIPVTAGTGADGRIMVTTVPEAEKIIRAAAQASGVTHGDLVGPRRMRSLAVPRHIAMLIAHQRLPHLSTPYLARVFGRRDHSTILHGIKRAQEMLGEEPYHTIYLETCRRLDEP